MKDMPPPQCTMEVETFLGKTGYYQRFIPDYAKIAAPLTALKRKSCEFQFGPEQQLAFETLKEALCSAPLLKYPDFSRPFYIATDASGYGLGAVLFQKYGEDLRDEMPVAYASRTLKDAELRYSATEREALAVWWACDHFVEYIDEHEVTIYTDHKALLALPHKEMSNRRLQLIAHKLAEFKYTLEYRPGKNNANADALSRYPIVPCKGRRSKEVQTLESIVNDFDASIPLPAAKFKKAPDPGPTRLLSLKPRLERPKGTLEPMTPKSILKRTNQTKDPVATPATGANCVPLTRPAKLAGIGVTFKGPASKGALHAVQLVLPQPRLEAAVTTMRELKDLQLQVPEYQAIRHYLERGILPPRPVIRLNLVRTLDQFYIDEDSGLLCRLNDAKIGVACAPPSLRQLALYDAHKAPVSGHFGVAKTLARLVNRYWWPAMSRTVAEYIQDCALCQAHKVLPRPPRELLGDRPPPQAPWERIHVDVWSPGGQSTDGNKYVLGAVDTFSKYLLLIAMPDQTSESIVDAIVNRLMMHYGMPNEIVSDGAMGFASQLQEELFRVYGVTRKITTPYRPQSNGQIERMFRTVRPILASLCSRAPRKWDHYLAMAAHSYNTSFHLAVNDTPFYIMFGRSPHPLPDQHERHDAKIIDNMTRLSRWKVAREAARVGLLAEQQRSKDSYDEFRARPQGDYKIGECVLTRVTKVPANSVHKLHPKFVGPYRITNICGSVLTVEPLHQVSRRTNRLYKIHKDRVRRCEANFPNFITPEELLAPFADPASLEPRLEPEAETD